MSGRDVLIEGHILVDVFSVNYGLRCRRRWRRGRVAVEVRWQRLATTFAVPVTSDSRMYNVTNGWVWKARVMRRNQYCETNNCSAACEDDKKSAVIPDRV